MKRFFAVFFVVLLVGLLGLPAVAKTGMGFVKLKNGNIVYGEIVKNNEETVILRYTFDENSYGEVTIDKNYVLDNGVIMESDIPRSVYVPPAITVEPTATAVRRLPEHETVPVVPDTGTGTGSGASETGAEPSTGTGMAVVVEEDPLGDPFVPAGWKCSLRGPKSGWVKDERTVSAGAPGQTKTLVVFTGSTHEDITRRIIAAKMRSLPKTGEERRKFILDLMQDLAPSNFIMRHEGTLNLPAFAGETYFLEGNIGKMVFRYNYYFARENTYVLAFYASAAEFESLRGLFGKIEQSVVIEE